MKPGRTFHVLGWATLICTAAGEQPAKTESLADRLHITYAPATNAASPTGATIAADSDAPMRLPHFEVRDTRIPLSEDRLFTPKGRLAEAKRRHLSPLYQHTFGPLAGIAALYFDPLSLLRGVRANDAEAMVFYEQEQALRRNQETTSLENLGRLAEAAARIEQTQLKQHAADETPTKTRR